MNNQRERRVEIWDIKPIFIFLEFSPILYSLSLSSFLWLAYRLSPQPGYLDFLEFSPIFYFLSLSSFLRLAYSLSPQPGHLELLHNPFPECMSSSGPYKIFIHFQKYLHSAVKCRQSHMKYQEIAILIANTSPTLSFH